MFSTSGEGGGGVHLSTFGDILSTSGDVQYVGEISRVQWDMFSISRFSIENERFYQLAPPHAS